MGKKIKQLKFIDLFCGIGGFRIAFEQACMQIGIQAQNVFSSDINDACSRAYSANFGDTPVGDITQVNANEIPDHNVLLAGFPCQPFSIIGDGKGFMDVTRGTLFFDIARIIQAKKPKAFVLENVKRLVTHDGGKTMKTIMTVLKDLGYACDYHVLNALDFGLPQKRERVFIVGIRGILNYEFPKGGVSMKPLTEILEDDKDVPEKFFASEYIRNKRKESHVSKYRPAIWHENKSANITSYPYSCALRANGSYNYLLVNGERRLTPREMLRLQGYPDSFEIVCTDEQTRNQAGNSLPIPVAQAVILPLLQQMMKRVVYQKINSEGVLNGRKERTQA